MPATLPQVRVFQQFQSTPRELTNPLRAFVVGAEYLLHRYSVTSERVKVGTYDPALDVTFDWLADLGRQPGAVVDQNYTRVYLKNALLSYWDSVSGAQTTSASYSSANGYLVHSVVGYNNRIKVDSHNIVASTGYALNPVFNGRDVKVGDYVKISAVVDSVSYSAEGSIIGFVANEIAAAIGTASKSSTNQATNAGPTAVSTIITGGTNLTGVSATSYDGLSVGVVTETYTVTVIKASTGGDPRTSILNIVSASGKDSVYGYVPTTTDWNQDIPLGTNGAVFRFNITAGSGLNNVAGESWSVLVNQAFTSPTPTASGTYTGTVSGTYIVTVTRGGTTNASNAEDKPFLTVTTNTNFDNAPAKLCSGSSGAQAFAVGNYGVVLNFNQVKLRAGDQYFVPVTGTTDGAIQTFIIDRPLPSQILSTNSQTFDLTVYFCIKQDIEVHKTLNALNVINWTQDEDGITLNDSMYEVTSSWQDGTEALPILGGDIYIHWRELLANHTDRIYSANSISDLTSTFTSQIDPDNPLVYGAYKALSNSGTSSAPSTGIRLMAVASDDVAGYTAALNLAEGRDDIYAIVPMTFDSAIQQLVATHITDQSTPEIGEWRIGIFSTEEVNPAPIVEANSDLSSVLATTAAKVLTLYSTSDVSFLTAAVRPGDIVRTSYSNDIYGNETYTSYVVDTVDGPTTLTLTTAPSPAIGTPTKIEIWRTLDADGIVDQIGNVAQAWATGNSFSSRRIINVFPGSISSGGVMVPGYYAAAAVAGLIGATAPQQGLTNVELQGFDNASTVVNRFSRTQLDTLAGYGVWIITQDLQTNTIYTRQQLTTDTTDLNTSEMSVTKNVDSISFYFRNSLKPFIGRANLTQTTIDVITTVINSGINYLLSAGFNPLIGGQVLEGTRIVQIRPHAILKDRLVIVIKLVIPYPLNVIEAYLVI